MLPASLYLAGFVVGPLLLAPLSESARLGRRPVLAAGAAAFLVLSVAAAAAGARLGWPGFLAVRFALGVVGSPPASVFGGVIGDVYADEVERGRMLMVWLVFSFLFPFFPPSSSPSSSPFIHLSFLLFSRLSACPFVYMWFWVVGT